jgi:hypothetical protein
MSLIIEGCIQGGQNTFVGIPRKSVAGGDMQVGRSSQQLSWGQGHREEIAPGPGH